MKKVSKITDKVGQWTGERLNRFESTKLEEDFVDLEKRVDATDELLKTLPRTLEEYLQPNSTQRAKLDTGKRYDVQEGFVAEVLIKGSNGLPDSTLGDALALMGQAFQSLADHRRDLDNEVLGHVVRPTSKSHDEMKDLNTHRKRLESRRLDYDAKRRMWEKKPNDLKIEDDFRVAESKYEVSKETVYNGMVKVMACEPEYCRQLLALVQAQLTFAQSTLDVLNPLIAPLEACIDEAARNPPMEQYHQPPSLIDSTSRASPMQSGRNSPLITQKPLAPTRTWSRPMSTGSSSNLARRHSARELATAPCRPSRPPGGDWVIVMYDFEAQGETELDLRKGDQVEVIKTLDSNWMEGRFRGRTGIFPVNFVERC